MSSSNNSVTSTASKSLNIDAPSFVPQQTILLFSSTPKTFTEKIERKHEDDFEQDQPKTYTQQRKPK